MAHHDGVHHAAASETFDLLLWCYIYQLRLNSIAETTLSDVDIWDGKSPFHRFDHDRIVLLIVVIDRRVIILLLHSVGLIRKLGEAHGALHICIIVRARLV